MRGERGSSFWGGSTAVAFLLVCGCCTVLFANMIVPETAARIGVIFGGIWLAVSVVMWTRAHILWTQENAVLGGPARPPSRALSFFSRGARKPLDDETVDRLQWEYWSAKADLEVWQAAYLWVGSVPPKRYPGDLAPPKVRIEVDRLKKGLEIGALKPNQIQSSGGTLDLITVLAKRYVDTTEYATVSRDSLKEYAAKVGDAPAFLFASG